jgi:hypothetical protein
VKYGYIVSDDDDNDNDDNDNDESTSCTDFCNQSKLTEKQVLTVSFLLS